MEILDVKFDKFTLVGNLYLEAETSLQKFLDNHDAKILSLGTSRVVAKLYADNLYLEYDLLKGKAYDKGNFRIEYNPSNLTVEQSLEVVNAFKPMCNDWHFTRLDLAFDCDFDLSKYTHEHVNPVKWQKIGGATGAIETLYFGSRESNFYSRTYNKKLQLKEAEGLEYAENEHWWRYEVEIKNRKAIESMISLDFPVFERVRFKKHGYEDLEVEEMLIIEGLIRKPELMGLLSQYKRSKYRKIMANMQAEDLTPMFEEKLKNKLPQLKRALEAWQPIPKFIDIYNRKWD